MKVGYARVSSLGQSLDTQIEKLTAFGCEKVFQEKRSGATRQKREAVNAALEFCREGDVLVITKLDRLARSMFDLQEIAQTLDRKKVDFVVLDQNIDTTTPAGRLTFHLLGAVAEFERDLIAERRNEGIEKAKAKGVKFGRAEKLTPAQVEALRAAKRAGESRAALQERFGISKSTFYRLCAENGVTARLGPPAECVSRMLRDVINDVIIDVSNVVGVACAVKFLDLSVDVDGAMTRSSRS